MYCIYCTEIVYYKWKLILAKMSWIDWLISHLNMLYCCPGPDSNLIDGDSSSSSDSNHTSTPVLKSLFYDGASWPSGSRQPCKDGSALTGCAVLKLNSSLDNSLTLEIYPGTWTCTVQMESLYLRPGLMTQQATGPTFSSSTRWSQCRPPTARGQTEGIWADWAFRWCSDIFIATVWLDLLWMEMCTDLSKCHCILSTDVLVRVEKG